MHARWFPAVALCLAACGGSRPPAEQPSLDFPDASPGPASDAAPVAVDAAPPAPTAFTIPATPIKVTRIKPGKKPEPVRYKFAPGAQVTDDTLDVTLEFTILSVGKTQSQVAPTNLVGRVVEVTGVDAAGTALVRATMDRGSTPDAAMTEALEQLKGTVIEASVDARGRTGDATITSRAPDLDNATTLARMLENRARAIVLPDEPLGIGGQWKVVGREDVNGIDTEVTTTYTLTARKGTEVTVTGKLVATAPAQVIHAANDKVGTIELAEMTGTGTMTATIDLTRPAPALTYSESYDAKMKINGQDARVVTKLESRQTTRTR